VALHEALHAGLAGRGGQGPTVPLAVAVAASSAFPPVLSPAHLELEPSQFTDGSGADLQMAPYTSEVVLCDGGVYDNLGLETAYKRYKTILVSDAGGKTQPEPDPKHDWIGHTLRVFDLIDNQVRSLRKRQLINAYVAGERQGAYWGIRTDIAQYGLADALDCPFSKTIQLANVKTRLKRVDQDLQKKLINWGYAVCDAAMRRHVQGELPVPAGFPYLQAGI
jgi:NTE family protein